MIIIEFAISTIPLNAFVPENVFFTDKDEYTVSKIILQMIGILQMSLIIECLSV